jgi:hypothetical protein
MNRSFSFVRVFLFAAEGVALPPPARSEANTDT